jgi:hypothetical protein
MVTIPIIKVLIILIVVGVALYLINKYIPMEQVIKTILNVVIILLVVIWLLNIFGLFSV